MKYDTIFFDLDGTITDSAPGILASVRHALLQYWRAKSFNHQEYVDQELNFFIGPPLLDSFIKLLGCSREDAELCIKWYREFYTGKVAVGDQLSGMLMNSVYAGVEPTLGELKERGVKIVLATAKPEPFARQILDYFQLSRHFDAIHGATLEEGRNHKAQVIKWALEHSGNVGEVLMIGDRADDVMGAKANGIPCIGALWGYGSREELTTAGASILLHSILELPALIDR